MRVEEIYNSSKQNYILPFLWMRGEEEDVIKTEISKIYESGIKAVCVEARPHPDFTGPKWWKDLDIVMEEAKKRNMRVWVLDDAHFPTGYANGLIEKKYPERRKKYINFNTVDILSNTKNITINVKAMSKPRTSFLDFGKQKDIAEQEKNEIIAVLATKLIKNGVIDEDIIDLTNLIDGSFLTCSLPESSWRIFVIYETKTDGGDQRYINMVDKESVKTQIEAVYEPHFERYKNEFGKTFAGFFSDEPAFGNVKGFDFDESIGRKDMPLPWSREVKEQLINKLGNTWKEHLPFLWATSISKNNCINSRYVYMDIITELYRKNFSEQLGTWCEDHGVEYIGHVVEDSNQHTKLGSGTGHFFRALAGQHMSGIDCIGGQIVPGGAGYERVSITKGDGEFYHYALAKLGASLGHLDPLKKGRTMCELFGAYGWKLGVRDMKYITDHLIVRGINYLVPHAFSMKDYPDNDCPPHFYARGKNPQFKQFGTLMEYSNRLCNIFNNGSHIANIAILYNAENEWASDCMKLQTPARTLTENQIEFDIVSIDMLDNLSNFNGRLEKNKFIINNIEFKCLIIPYSEYITKELINFIKATEEINIIFINKLPSRVTNITDTFEETALLNILSKCKVMSIENLVDEMWKNNYEEIKLLSNFKDMTYYHYYKNGNIFMMQNESVFNYFRGEVEIKSLKKQAYIYKPLENKLEILEVFFKGDKAIINVEIAPCDSIIIFENIEGIDFKIDNYKILSDSLKELNKKDISKNWTYSLTRYEDYPNFSDFKLLNDLIPISELEPTFTGVIRYEKEINLDLINTNSFIKFEYVYESINLWINNKFVGEKIVAPYIFDISNYLIKGENKIVIEVTTTLDRDKFNHPTPPYILWHDPIEPTGIFGNISLFI